MLTVKTEMAILFTFPFQSFLAHPKDEGFQALLLEYVFMQSKVISSIKRVKCFVHEQGGW